MQEFSLNKSDRELEKKATEFASDTIRDVEVKSKMLSSTMNQITNFSNMR